jgi:Tol biopolymer transport system component/DNA-binding winged helix-turn-helix (wHTH) protein
MPLPIRRVSLSSASQSQRILFDNFEADLRSGELRKNGSRLKLQAQPFRLLVLLLKNPGEVVTRDEVCQELWPDNTFVDFEHGLAAAVNKIREAIGDSAENPRYIETLPKRGYRFIGKLKAEEPEVIPVVGRDECKQLAAVSQPKAGVHGRWTVGLLALAVAAGLGVLFLLLVRSPNNTGNSDPVKAVPFAADPGIETAPSFSPDGSRIAFSWDKRSRNGSERPQYDLYVKAIGSETVLRLTNHPSTWISSTWSPDGTQIAFHRLASDDNGIYVVPALGGPERKLVTTRTPYHVAAPISWSSDGKWLAYSDTENSEPGDRAFLLNMETLENHEFPHNPSCNHEGRLTFSHSGRDLAVLCVHSTAFFEYFITNLQGTSKRPLVAIHDFVSPLVWAGDDKSVILVRENPIGNEFEEIQVRNGSMRKLMLPAGDWPAISGDGHKLAFSLAANHVNIWRRDLLHPKAPPAQMFASTLQQNNARYSPDGRHVAFASTRSGVWSVWLADTDGSNLVQISHGSPAGFPRWSPDSQKIVFEVEEPDGVLSVYTADISDRVPHRLRTNIKQANRPFWSNDGKWIYFRGYEGVGHALYRCPAQGGDAVLLDAGQDPISPAESTDGKVLYFPDRNLNANMMMLELDQPGAKSKPVPDMSRILVETQWVLVPNGIYFTPQNAPRTVSFYDFATQQTHPIFVADRDLDDGMSVSPDGRYMLYAQVDENTSSVMLVNDFR